MSKECDDLWRTARFGLLRSYGFFALIASRFNWKEAAIATTAIDEKFNFLYNAEHTKAMSLQDRIFEVGHETGHLVQDSIAACPLEIRNNPVEWNLWNYASDIVIDGWLCERLPRSEVSKKNVPQKYLDRFKGWHTYRVYLALKEDQEAQQKAQDKAAQDKQKADGGTNGQSPGGGNEPGVQPKGLGGRECCSNHFHNQSDTDKLKIKQVVIQAAKAAEAAEKGSTPGEVEEFLNNIVKPQIHWRTALMRYLTALGKPKLTWKRPSRRGMATGNRLQKYEATPKPDVAFLIDTSGSMTKGSIDRAMSEMAGILKAFGINDLWVYFHDVPCYRAEQISLSKLRSTDFKIKRGGTSHIPVFAKMMETHKPKVIVAMTDLCSDFPDNPHIPTIWLTPKTTTQSPPWGIKMEVDDVV